MLTQARVTLAALAGAALLVGLAQPQIGTAMRRFQAEGVVDDFSAALAEARDTAVAGNRVVRVGVDETRRTWAVDGRYRDRLPDGVALAGPQADILFYPDGSSTGGQVVVSAGHEAWAVAVELLSGGIRRHHAAAR